jgi:hypothetical protein
MPSSGLNLGTPSRQITVSQPHLRRWSRIAMVSSQQSSGLGAYSDITTATSLPLLPLPFFPYILTGGMAMPPATRQ